MLEKDAIQCQHFHTVASLVQKQFDLEQIIDEMASQQHKKDQQTLNSTIDCLLNDRQLRCVNETTAITKAEKVMMEISDLRRGLTLPFPATSLLFKAPAKGSEWEDVFKVQH